MTHVTSVECARYAGPYGEELGPALVDKLVAYLTPPVKVCAAIGREVQIEGPRVDSS